MKIFLTAFLVTLSSIVWSCPVGYILSSYNGNGDFNFHLSLDFSTTSHTNLLQIDWNFGDNTPVYSGNNQIVSHTYISQGNYTVTASVLCSDSNNDSCTQVISFSLNHNQISCPVASFTPIKNITWCKTGTMNLSWTFCNEDYNNDTYPDNYWTPNTVVWNLSDGNSVTTTGLDWLTYTFQSPDVVTISATVYFTGLNGESCSVPMFYLSDANTSQDPCEVIINSSTIFTNFIEITPTYAEPNLSTNSLTVCAGENFSLIDNGIVTPSGTMVGWSYNLLLNGNSIQSNSGLPTNGTSFYSNQFTTLGQYTYELNYLFTSGEMSCSSSSVITIEVVKCDTLCEDCSTFKPIPGNRYWVSAWVREAHAVAVKNYINSSLELQFNGIGGLISTVAFSPTGEIIDGWQRIVGSFNIPSNTTQMTFNLKNSHLSVEAFFDDIRVHPFNASMKSYVYDPATLLLSAELDDNNYATFYEYDKEGQLIRIKKETARGIMTIQESRSNNPKSE